MKLPQTPSNDLALTFGLLLAIVLGSTLAQTESPINCMRDFRIVTYGGTINLFRESTQNLTWLQARASCDLCYAGLANVDNSAVQSGLVNQDPDTELWVGRYSRGSAVANLVWNPGLGSVNPKFDSTLRPALCQVVTIPQPPPVRIPTPTSNPSCLSSERFFGTTSDEQRLLLLTSQHLTWEQGRSACQQCFNTSLANVLVSRRISPRITGSEYWIGSYGGGLQISGLKLIERTGDVVVDAASNTPRPILCEPPPS